MSVEAAQLREAWEQERARVARLEAQAEIKQTWAVGSLKELGGLLDEVRAENDRLRAALSVFADLGNWYEAAPRIEWDGPGDAPWAIAQEALQPPEPGKEPPSAPEGA